VAAPSRCPAHHSHHPSVLHSAGFAANGVTVGKELLDLHMHTAFEFRNVMPANKRVANWGQELQNAKRDCKNPARTNTPNRIGGKKNVDVVSGERKNNSGALPQGKI